MVNHRIYLFLRRVQDGHSYILIQFVGSLGLTPYVNMMLNFSSPEAANPLLSVDYNTLIKRNDTASLFQHVPYFFFNYFY
jgi:hypothetical protein